MTVRARVALRVPGLRQPMPLPTRSLMARIGTDEQGRPLLLGAEVDVPGAVSLTPGQGEVVGEAEFWYEDAAQYVVPAAELPLWAKSAGSGCSTCSAVPDTGGEGLSSLLLRRCPTRRGSGWRPLPVFAGVDGDSRWAQEVWRLFPP